MSGTSNHPAFGENYTIDKADLTKIENFPPLDAINGKEHVVNMEQWNSMKSQMEIDVDWLNTQIDIQPGTAPEGFLEKGMKLALYAAVYKSELIGKYLKGVEKISDADEKKKLDAVCQKLRELSVEFKG